MLVLFCCVRKKSIGIIKMCFGGKRPDWMEEKGNCSSQGEKKALTSFFLQVAGNTVEFRKLPGGACRYERPPSGATIPTCRDCEQEKNRNSN